MMIQKCILLLATFVLFFSWNISAQNVSNTNTADDIRVIARLDIQQGKWEAFEKIAAQCKEAVETKDTGTLQYDWFYNDTKTECVVIEHYIDSKAVLEHSANVGAIVGQLLKVSTLTLEVYGDPSHELKNAYKGREIKFYKALF